MGLKEDMLEQLKDVERLARTSRAGRLLHHPYRYLSAILFKDFIYPRSRKEKIKRTQLFNGLEMTIVLPSSTDIYLTGGKSHDSEIRLARFIIRNLQPGQHFLDIGAHYGYFTLIASCLTGPTGKVVALEPAGKTHTILSRNCTGRSNVTVIRKAIADEAGEIVFYEFPNLFSEYNAIDIEQFREEKWFSGFRPEQTVVPATTIDELCSGDFNPALIKIDVEGAELKVMKGGLHFFEQHSPLIAMEYLAPERGNTEHSKAVSMLREKGYRTFLLGHEGDMQETADIEAHLRSGGLESDNIILSK
ncbi:FkbM family methyltransferase [Taibaiella helva]|uniref:FkbM family methyltransferase n=1 Tax=Taibaiella helva TaxID=2301235 RepID=UPI000E582F08|nr:FkbM family methyltransferase [Taibaiella helva]